MKRNTLLFASSFLLVFAVQPAFCGVPCADLKAKIDDGLKAKGVENYTLTVVRMSDSTTPGKTVATCDGNTNKILYSRGESSAAAPAGEPSPAAKPAPEKKPATK